VGGRGINRNYIRKVCTKIPTVGKGASEKTREKWVRKRRNLSGKNFFLCTRFSFYEEIRRAGGPQNIYLKKC
jgi:hypothetical protein